MDPCALRLDLCPAQAGYSAQFSDGIIQAQLDGGFPWMRLDIPGKPHAVSATWVLDTDEYCIFQGFFRLWQRSGGDSFAIDLILDTPQMMTYEATFVPGSVRLVGASAGKVFTISAQLMVMPAFVDPCDDYCSALALINAAWGPDACEVLETVGRIVNDGRLNVWGRS